MKRIIALSLLLIMTLITLSASSFEYIWSWRSNDPDAKYYRYCTDDDPEWRTAQSNSFRVHYFYDALEPHTFYIQQSYDGKNWSETAEKTYKPIYEEESNADAHKVHHTFGFNVAPYQVYTYRNPTSGSEDMYSQYSVAADMHLTKYFFGFLGVFGEATGAAYTGQNSITLSNFNAGVFTGPDLRIVNGKQFGLALRAGVGAQVDFNADKVFFTPAALAAVDATIYINDHLSFSIMPSVVVAYDVFSDSTDKYQAYSVRAASLGLEWRQ